jgi:hypothetical protein
MLKGGNETSYQIHSIVLDCNGLEKRQLKQAGIVDLSGTKLPTGTTISIWAWDGHTGVNYNHGIRSSGSAILDNSRPGPLKNQRQPWRTYTGLFADELAKAIETEKPIKVETLSNGKYQMSFIDSLNNETIAIVDPNKGFSCTKQTFIRDGINNGYHAADYEEFANGVWFPVTAEIVSKSKEGIVISKSIVKTSNIKVNDPNFTENLFHVDLPKGARVKDKILSIEYVVGDPMSIKTYPDGISPDQVARQTLNEMARETNQKHQDIEIFIPKVSIALEKEESFVLDFSDGELVNPKKKPESEESNKYLTELGKGDIAWDGVVVATRGAKVLIIKQESERPLKFTEGKWTGSYKLPEKVELPYSMLVVTNEGVNYLLKIKRIESGGITITYRELNPDELILYKQKK